MSRKGILLLLIFAMAVSACSNRTPPTNRNTASTQPQESAPINPNQKDVEGFTPLMNAIKNGNQESAQQAIQNGADVNAAIPSGVTALFLAAGMGDKELVKTLIEKGANVNHRADGGFTPLMQAALTGQLEIVKMLLDAGADPTVKDTANKTAADWATDKNHKDVADLLKQRITAGGGKAGKKS
ncbi:MAG: ankyrin repeat domain-containing protein [Acidobacteria bacterium]|nr:ankyrin repeat domain-containing protein [Acidobacteriota bacterium]